MWHADSGPIRLEICDVSGRVVAVPLEGSVTPGRHHVEWDGCTAGRRQAGSGIYFVRLSTGAATAVGKLLRLE